MDTETDNSGGPAFPVTPTDRSGQIADTQCGMSLRDYFAGQALAGQCSIEDDSHYATPNVQTLDEWRRDARESTARYCYEMADALIAARGK